MRTESGWNSEQTGKEEAEGPGWGGVGAMSWKPSSGDRSCPRPWETTRGGSGLQPPSL